MQRPKDPTLPVKIVVFGIFLVIAGMVAYGIHQKNKLAEIKNQHAKIQNQLAIEKIEIERKSADRKHQLNEWDKGFKTEIFGTKPGCDGKGNCKKP